MAPSTTAFHYIMHFQSSMDGVATPSGENTDCKNYNTCLRVSCLSTLSCTAFCDRSCLLSTRKFVWVLLGSDQGQNKSQQLLDFCSALLKSE